MTPLAHLCPGCGRTTTHAGRCATCRAPRNQAKRARPEWQGVYNTTRWRHLRRIILANAEVCERCGEPPRPGDPLTAGHIQPFTGPDDPLAWDLLNIQPEHRSCNGREAAQRRR